MGEPDRAIRMEDLDRVMGLRFGLVAMMEELMMEGWETPEGIDSGLHNMLIIGLCSIKRTSGRILRTSIAIQL